MSCLHPVLVRRWLRRLAFLLAFVAAQAHANGSLSWFNEAGSPTDQASVAITALESAADHGLDPADYAAAALRQALAAAQQDPPLDADRQAQLDAALTSALQRYLVDLRRGRVDPREIHARFDVPNPDSFDPAALLAAALATDTLAQALRDAEPRVPLYAALRQALAQYRALAGHSAWLTPLTLPARALSPGEGYAGLPVLAQRLEALGDLPAGTFVPARYEGALVDALRAFQERHGLEVDGVLGPATLKALNVPPSERVRQIELSLERLRWTPLLHGPRMVVVNVPEFTLRAYEVEGTQLTVRLAMKVIVGKALDTRTPLFDEDMRFIEFSPYWNVPPSIARGEIIPRLRRDPAYFGRQGFEFVTDSGRVVTTLSAENLDAVLHRGWRIRQRPGPRNVLGDIKFIFPNNQNIYLHHTPEAQLFARVRRDFSHGCIRVEAPIELAKFVLQDRPDWTEDRIREAMDAGKSRTIALEQPLPVLIAYSTVVVKAGRVFFHPDLYGHDPVLDRALQARSAALAPLLTAGLARP